jgi:hypothetical protein
VLLEVLTRLGLEDDGRASRSELVLVALDRLGNLGDPETPIDVRVQTSGIARIVEPDRDGDPFAETVRVEDARGTRLVLDDAGGAFDDANTGVVWIESAAGMYRVDVFLADPDVDDSGEVTWRDLVRVLRSAGAELGTPGFEPALDQDGNGVIDRHDLRRVAAQLRQSIPVP